MSDSLLSSRSVECMSGLDYINEQLLGIVSEVVVMPARHNVDVSVARRSVWVGKILTETLYHNRWLDRVQTRVSVDSCLGKGLFANLP